ncbi:MAG: large-conductance mechanosensitive channel protein MscL [Succinivibrionaceae bacterium]
MDNMQKKSVSFFKEFRDFALRGNVLDMAIGVLIGSAFGKIVSSLVSDIIMPLFGMMYGKIDLKKLTVILHNKTENNDAIILNYGIFLQHILDFIMIAFVIFVSIKLINRLKESIAKEDKEIAAQEAATPSEPPADVKLLTEIRDLLKEQNK